MEKYKRINGSDNPQLMECIEANIPIYVVRWDIQKNKGFSGSESFGSNYMEARFAYKPDLSEIKDMVTSWLETVVERKPIQIDDETVWYDADIRSRLEAYYRNTTGSVRIGDKQVDSKVAAETIAAMNRYDVAIDEWLALRKGKILSAATMEEIEAVDWASDFPTPESLSSVKVVEEITTKESKENLQKEIEKQSSSLVRMLVNRVSLTAEEALQLQVLFPVWGEKGAEMGKPVESGFRFQYEDKLYEVLLSHSLQADWIPGTDTLSLYKVVEIEKTGAFEDPIVWSQGMELFNGKYYSEGDILYKCVRDSGMPMAYNLSDLVSAGYVELVITEEKEGEEA